MPFSPLIFISTLLHAYVVWRLLPALAAWPAVFWPLTCVLLASSVLMPLGLGARRLRRRSLADGLAWAGMMSMGLFSSLFVLTLLRDAGLLAWTLASWVRPLQAPARGLAVSAATVAALALAMTLWGLFNARRVAAVRAVDVPLRGLPAALHGLRIAQISDLHVGPTIKRGYVEAIVHAVNRLDADFVALTGDLVDGSVPELAPHIAPLAALRSRHGSFFVTGNHEYYAGAPAWIRELRRLGLRVLLNEHVVLDHDGADLVLAGVTDHSAHHFEPSHLSSPQAALDGAPAGAALRVLLAHQPRAAEAAEKAGFELQLSGHTHGGQFWPWNHFVPLQQPYTAGLHRLGAMWVYVSRGTGYWGPPKRLGAPSEIAHLRLVTAPD